MIDGVLNIYKEKGFTSHDVVAKLRGILHQKKIGHTGTLDPDATGVLPICLGKATKLCDMLTDKSKTYRTVMKLGIVTDTQDITGTVLQENDCKNIDDEKIVMEVINSFIGEYDQIPPMYSALKVNGKKLYEYARAGQEIERKARKVFINSIEDIVINLENYEISMVVDCSKGTYIRTLCHDIGEKLQTGACMKELERIRVSCFELENAVTLSQVEEIVTNNEIEKYITPIEDMFSDVRSIRTTPDTDRLLLNGNKLDINDVIISWETVRVGDNFRVYDSNMQFKAIYTYDEENKLVPMKMFL